MKRPRVFGGLFLAVLALAASRDGYRSAYRAWRELDPALEHDVASAGPEIATRTAKMAAAAARFGSERTGFLKAIAEESEHGVMSALTRPDAPPLAEIPNSGPNRVTVQTGAVQRNIASFAGDPDPEMQPLQQMLEHENSVLKSLNGAISDRQKAMDAARKAADAAAQLRPSALGLERDAIAGLTETAAETNRQTAMWVDYYNTLAEELGSGGTPAKRPAAAVPPASAPVAQRDLSRYTGQWTFPDNGTFHGSQPEIMELIVRQEGGHATGSVVARFKVAPGAENDAALRFIFSGTFTNSNTQVFSLETSDHARGIVRLTPGPAVNLLQVSFEIDPRPGKIRLSDAVLMRK